MSKSALLAEHQRQEGEGNSQVQPSSNERPFHHESLPNRFLVGKISPRNTFANGSFSRFKTSFAGPRAAKNYFAAVAKHGHQCRQQADDDLFVGVPINVREDLDMQQQLMAYAAEERERIADINAKARERSQRESQHDMVHLKALISTGIAYQASNPTPSAFFAKIIKASAQASVQARGTIEGGLISKEQAENYRFVEAVLFSDIKMIYPQYGYETTLNSLMALRIWDLK